MFGIFHIAISAADMPHKLHIYDHTTTKPLRPKVNPDTKCVDFRDPTKKKDKSSNIGHDFHQGRAADRVSPITTKKADQKEDSNQSSIKSY